MRLPAVTSSTEAVSRIRTWPRDATGTPRRYGAPPLFVHRYRGVVAIEAVHRAPVGVHDQALGALIGARRQQHSHDHIVGRARMVIGEQLFDEARQTADDFVHEPQARTVMDL